MAKMCKLFFAFFCISLCAFPSSIGQEEDEDPEFLYEQFPSDFEWGFATASYQIEGAWNTDGKGENIWDTFSHKNPSPIFDQSTGDVACDSYHKYKEDVQLLKNMGVHFYRFSLSWSRILPDGTTSFINQPGIDYYNNLINELIANDIVPMITLYHWDLPQALQDRGGWPGGLIIDDFVDYARVAYENFGDRVKHWITFNEPWVVCIHGFSTVEMAPGIHEPRAAPYQCAHTIIKSHAEAYHLYQDEFKATQGGKVGITLDLNFVEPLDPNNQDDVDAAERGLQFKHGWFASPIFFGKYPDIMVELIADKSEAEGDVVGSRLPTFEHPWPARIQGTWDFLGLNHYTTELATTKTDGPSGWFGDQNNARHQDPSWPQSSASWLKTVPWGFRKLLKWLKDTYGNPEIFITENGFADFPHTGIEDTGRVHYYKHYINNMLRAIKLDGCNVTKYTAWSLLDNFEWARGYSERFGVHHVDFVSPQRPRTPKKSAAFLKQIFADNGWMPRQEESTTEGAPAPEGTTESKSSREPQIFGFLLCIALLISVSFAKYLA